MGAWSVFHQGVSKLLGISFGQVSILCSLAIIIIVSALGQRVGLGTILNMLLIGWLIDFFDYFHLIADAGSLAQGTMMIFLSMIFNALGSCFYIACGLGCGPRDGLMSALTQKSHLSVGLIRFTIEGVVFLVGWKLGGQIGLGTVLNVFSIGFIINGTYKIMDFNIASVHHQTLTETLHYLRGGFTCL